ncbi:DUF2972 domain-containing protein, partial [Campylobacter molothri]|uniref:DUF2972 domain-containing protein n=1 Tax=Campylobacter molothri TaxID=1032242 RepID=UPI00301D5145|nr:DUF2972 domain-containing protein [Campylobacter sp. RM10542]
LFTFGLTGHSILLRALIHHGIKLQWYSNDYKKLYLDNFKYNYDCIHILFLDRNDFNKSFKYINLLPQIITIFLIRDPISKFKTGLNHGGYKKGCNDYDIVDNNIPIQQILDRVQYPFLEQITLEYMLNYWIKHGVWLYDSIIKNICKEKIYFLDMENLMPNKILLTLADLKLKFKLNNVENLEILQNIVFGPYRYILPIIINFSFKSIDIKVYIELKDRMTNGNINLNYILKYKHNLLKDIVFSISKLDFKYLNSQLIKQISDFQKDFLDILDNKIKDIENKKWSENDILNEFKNNKLIRNKVFNMLYKELNFIKQHRPDIVASWKYYQEFEKMCEELDGESEIKQIENNSN